MKESMSSIRRNLKTKAKMIYFSNLFQITSILFLYALLLFPAKMVASGIASFIVKIFPSLGENLFFSYSITSTISPIITILATPLLYGIIFNINKVERLEPTTYSNYFIWFSKWKYTKKAFLVRINFLVRAIPFVLLAFSPVILGIGYSLFVSNPESHIKNLFTGNYLIEFTSQLSNIVETGSIDDLYSIDPVLIRNVGYQMWILIVCEIVKFVLLLRFFLVDYMIVKNPDMKISVAFKNSRLAMKGHYGELIVFILSFIPLILITSILCYFFSVFVYVYIFVANIIFANNIIRNYFREDNDEPIIKTVEEVQL